MGNQGSYDSCNHSVHIERQTNCAHRTDIPLTSNLVGSMNTLFVNNEKVKLRCVQMMVRLFAENRPGEETHKAKKAPGVFIRGIKKTLENVVFSRVCVAGGQIDGAETVKPVVFVLTEIHAFSPLSRAVRPVICWPGRWPAYPPPGVVWPSPWRRPRPRRTCGPW